MSPLRIGIRVSAFLCGYLSSGYWMHSSLSVLGKVIALTLTILVLAAWHTFLDAGVIEAENDRP